MWAVSTCVLGFYTGWQLSGTPLLCTGRHVLQIAIFSDVLADLGDSQSLEQNLSTFSGHMRQVTGILRDVGPRSLVLLDELGSGTDPIEGMQPFLAICIQDWMTWCEYHVLAMSSNM